MWNISHNQIGYIVGANERTQRLELSSKTTQKLTPTHEHIIRSAPKQFQDEIATDPRYTSGLLRGAIITEAKEGGGLFF